MKLFVGVTDSDWFEMLRSQPAVDEVNFWQPGGNRQFKTLQEGELLLFKLHAPQNFIGGGGVFLLLVPRTALARLGGVRHPQRREAARWIGCDPSRVRKLLKAGRLLGYRDGRRIRVRESSVVAYQDATPLSETSGAHATEMVRRTNRQRQREALAILERLGVRSER